MAFNVTPKCSGVVAHRFHRQDDGTWKAELVINVPEKQVEGWVLPEMNGTQWSLCC